MGEMGDVGQRVQRFNYMGRINSGDLICSMVIIITVGTIIVVYI